MEERIQNYYSDFWDYLEKQIIDYNSSLHIDSRWPSDITKLVTHLHLHLFEEGLTVTEIKQKCRICDNNISGRFSYYLGRSIKSYIDYHRIEMAKRLLRYDGVKVVHVALAVGYTSHGAFTRAFNRHVGCTPREFQEKVKEQY